MRKRMWIVISAVVAALAAALLLPSATFAYGPGGGPNGGPGGGRGGMMGGQNQSLVAVAAQVLGMPQDQLVAQLQAGKTIKDVAGPKATAIVDAFVKPRADRMAAAVAAGRMTQAQADQMLATMRQQVTDRLDDPWTPAGPGGGTGYVDENGDGQCDHAGAGMGPGMGGQAGRGRGGR